MCVLCNKRCMEKLLGRELPDDFDRWIVSEHIHSDSIYINAHTTGVNGIAATRIVTSMGLDPSASYVREPNFFERLLGITMEDKLKRARRKAQRFADRENEKIDREIEFCKKYGGMG